MLATFVIRLPKEQRHPLTLSCFEPITRSASTGAPWQRMRTQEERRRPASLSRCSTCSQERKEGTKQQSEQNLISSGRITSYGHKRRRPLHKRLLVTTISLVAVFMPVGFAASLLQPRYHLAPRGDRKLSEIPPSPPLSHLDGLSPDDIRGRS